MSIVTKSARVVFDSLRPCRRGFFGSADLAVDPVVRDVMQSLGYSAQAIAETAAWFDHHGTPLGCPIVDPADAFVIESAFRDPSQEASDRPWTGLTPTAPGFVHPEPDDAAWAVLAFATEGGAR